MFSYDKSKSKSSVTESFPIRINLFGAPTDTLQYTEKHGGIVVNVSAIMSDGSYPITVTVQDNADKGIEYESVDCKNIDTNFYKTITDNCGIPVKDVKIITCSQIPYKGSGLGTSSILIYGICKCLYKYYAIYISQEDLWSLTLDIEQLLGKGGWQDAIGASINGIKFIRVNKHREYYILGIKNTNWLNKHIQIIFTGKTRNASTVLQKSIKNLDKYGYKLKLISYLGFLSIIIHNAKLLKWCIRKTHAISSKYNDLYGVNIEVDNVLGAGGGGYGIKIVDNAKDNDFKLI